MGVEDAELTRWSAAPAKDVETAVIPERFMCCGGFGGLRPTTPLSCPMTYLNFASIPLWSAREMRASWSDVRKETEDSADGWTIKAGEMGLFSGDYERRGLLGCSASNPRPTRATKWRGNPPREANGIDEAVFGSSTGICRPAMPIRLVCACS